MTTLEQLQIKQEQLKAQIIKKKNFIRAQDRKIDVRRKIIVGAWLLSIKDSAWIQEKMDGHLEREGDRKLFGLDKKVIN